MRWRAGAGGRAAMLDVIFILLAFVVVVSSTRREEAESPKEESLRLRLPVLGEGEERPEPVDEPRLRIVLRGEKAVYVGDSRVPLRGEDALRRAIRSRVASEAGDPIVEIDASPDVPLRTALGVVEILRRERLERVLFLATVAPAPEEER